MVRTYDFGEADRVVVLLTQHHGLVRGAGHHQVIEHPHVDQRQRLAQPARQLAVGGAGLGQARRMVVRQDHRVALLAQPVDLVVHDDAAATTDEKRS